MVTLIKTWQDLLDAEEKYDEMRRPNDVSAMAAADAFKSECILDTSVIHDKETGKDELALDLAGFLKGYMEQGFRWAVLENTMNLLKKQPKNKAALFINTVMRKIGEDMQVSGDKTSVYDTEINTLNTFLFIIKQSSERKVLSGKKSLEESLLDSDSAIVWKILGGRTYDEPLKLGAMRFDADNPLHQKLADIAMAWEQGGAEKLKGFTDRWIHDTQPSEYFRQQAEKKNAVDKDSFDAMAEMSGMPVDKLYDEYKSRERSLSDGQKLTVIGWLIKRAPVDRDWCLKIGRMLPEIRGDAKYKSHGKATLLQDGYKVIEAFSKKYNPFLSQQMDALAELQGKYEDAQNDFDKKDHALKRHDKRATALDNRENRWNTFGENLYNIVRNLEQDVLEKSSSKKETAFYTNVYETMRNLQQKFSEKGDKKVLSPLVLQGKPWGIFGGTKEQKTRFATANKFIAEWNKKIKNVPKRYTMDDWSKGEELYIARSGLERDRDHAKWDVEHVESALKPIREFIDKFTRINTNIVKSGAIRAAVKASAEKRLAEKREETPVVESGYSEFDVAAQARDKVAADADLAKAAQILVEARKKDADKKAAEIKQIVEKLKKDDKQGKLSDERIMTLAEEMWLKEHGPKAETKAKRLQEIQQKLKRTNLPQERLEAYALKLYEQEYNN